MNVRAGVWLRLLWVVVAVCGLKIAANYVDQLRVTSVTARPCDAGMCVLQLDTRTGEYFWQPLPEPPARDIIPKQGL